MDYERIKNQANEILKNRSAECSYIEYKCSEKQLDKILIGISVAVGIMLIR